MALPHCKFVLVYFPLDSERGFTILALVESPDIRATNCLDVILIVLWCEGNILPQIVLSNGLGFLYFIGLIYVIVGGKSREDVEGNLI